MSAKFRREKEGDPTGQERWRLLLQRLPMILPWFMSIGVGIFLSFPLLGRPHHLPLPFSILGFFIENHRRVLAVVVGAVLT